MNERNQSTKTSRSDFYNDQTDIIKIRELWMNDTEPLLMLFSLKNSISQIWLIEQDILIQCALRMCRKIIDILLWQRFCQIWFEGESDANIPLRFRTQSGPPDFFTLHEALRWFNLILHWSSKCIQQGGVCKYDCLQFAPLLPPQLRSAIQFRFN